MYRQSWRFAQIFIVSIFWCGFLSPLAAQTTLKKSATDEYEHKIQDRNRQLDSIKTALENGKKKLADLKQQEGSSLAQLTQIDVNLKTTGVYVSGLSTQIDKLGAHIGILSDSVVSAQKRLAARQSIMKFRLKTMYQNSGFPNPSEKPLLDIITQSKSVTDIFNRIRYYNDLAHYDKEMLKAIDSLRIELSKRKDSLDLRKKNFGSLKTVKMSQQEALEVQKQQREKLIVTIRAEKEAFLASIAQLTAAERELSNLVAQLLKKRLQTKQQAKAPVKAPSEKPSQKPSRILEWPIKGIIVEEFGKKIHPIYNTITMNNGIDIKGSAGAVVSAAAQGIVAYVGSMRGLGNFIMIDHADVITIYAHLDRISVLKDEKVIAHQALGTLSTMGILHFEVRKSTDALDPQMWLPAQE